MLQAHPLIGHLILTYEPPSPLMNMAARIALHHHENWDGSGYPERLKADKISIEARITAVADRFEALTRSRLDRPALPLELAIREIVRHSGSQFDPDVVDAFSKALPEVAELLYRDDDVRRC